MITQAEFYELPEIIELVQIQRTNHPDSKEATEARAKTREIAKTYGVDKYFN